MTYDTQASEYDVYRRRSVTDWVLGLEVVAAMFEPLQNKKILDYGCGPGRFSQFLADRGATVLGLDTSEPMIQRAENFPQPKVSYRLIKAGTISDIVPDEYDGVTLNFVLCTMSSRASIIETLKKLYTVLKPGGMITALNANWEVCNGHEYISFTFDHMPQLIPGAKVGVTLLADTPVHVEDYFWSKQEYQTFFQEAGFRNIHLQETIATDDSYPWIDELTYSPLCIVRGEK